MSETSVEFTEKEVLEDLKSRVAHRGGQTAFAREAGISQSYLSDILKGSRSLRAVLPTLGYVERVVYQRINNGK